MKQQGLVQFNDIAQFTEKVISLQSHIRTYLVRKEFKIEKETGVFIDSLNMDKVINNPTVRKVIDREGSFKFSDLDPKTLRVPPGT